MNINETISKELDIGLWQVEAVVKLIDEGNTIPFIARYRKEMHGSLNDEQLRKLDERLTYLRSLEDRKTTVLSSIEEQGKLTEALKKQIEAALTMVELEDLYRPYKPKRRTRATIAAEKGLQPLADILLKQETDDTPENLASTYVDSEKGVVSVEEALSGAGDIIAENISDRADLRTRIREITTAEGILTSEVKKDQDDPQSVYSQYFHFQGKVSALKGHQILALNRGEKEKVLTVSLQAPEDQILGVIRHAVITRPDAPAAKFLEQVCEDAYSRLIEPAIEREVRGSLTAQAEDGAIDVFGKNLRQLLMQPPIAGQTVLGWDPAFRTGCKLAVVDETGKVLDTTVVYPTEPTTPAKIAAAKKKVEELISKYHVTLISCGNGTASRESEKIIAEIIAEVPEQVHYAIVSEAGASVYSASELATEEFPTFDVGQRSAASIARRLQDPLAELVKIDPKSIGVGQYQHDCDQKKLGGKLEGVVEDCVNEVGVDLNTASWPLLLYVSGITKKTAKSIVSYREENGKFEDRKQLLKVSGLGPKAFEQCAGFLRIRGGKNPLDMTGVHPESYEAAARLLKEFGYSKEDVEKGQIRDLDSRIRSEGGIGKLAEQFGVGKETLADIAKELEKPGRDPRSDMPKPVLRSDVMDMKDLKPGMILKGTVRNIVDFGAFVDIGVHEDGLVHISQMSDHGFVKSPLDVVSVGDIVDVKVLDVDLSRNRISLSMKLGEPAVHGKKQDGASSGGHKQEKQHPDGRREDDKNSRQRQNGRRGGVKTGIQHQSDRHTDGKSGGQRPDGRAGRSSRQENGGLDLSALLRKWN